MKLQVWKFIIIIAVIIIIILGLWSLFTNNDGILPATSETSSQVVKNGRIVCLPSQQDATTTHGPCILGFQDKNGAYYVLETNKSADLSELSHGEEVRVSGTLETQEQNDTRGVAGLIEVLSIENVSKATASSSGVQAGTSSPSSTTPTNWATFTSTGSSTATFQIKYPQETFSLLKKGENIPSAFGSYIPSCPHTDDFLACVYYSGSAYKGTNFGGAGVFVAKSPQLETKEACEAIPNGGPFAGSGKREMINGQDFAVYKIGGAAVGHDGITEVYQTWKEGECYQINARLSSTVFQNYPAGSIKEFTKSDRSQLRSTLNRIAETFEFSNTASSTTP